MADYTCPGEPGWHFFSDPRFLEEARLGEPLCAWCAGEIVGRDWRSVVEEHRED